MLINILLLAVACLVIWLATSFAIEAMERLSGSSRLSRLTLSLFVLGTVTSFPEIAITINAALMNAPQIALGNVIGSQIFLLFLVVPVLAIMTRGLQLKVQMNNMSLALALLIALVPMVALLNQGLELSEVLIIVGIYLVFVLTFSRQKNFLDRLAERVRRPEIVSHGTEVGKLIAAVMVILLASNTAVREIIEISAVLQTPRFLLSLIILPIATNLPELSLALGNLAAGRKALAVGDYLGAITFNSLLLAILVLSMGGSLVIGQNISMVIILFIVGLVVFWWACFSREILSVKEGLLLLMVYVVLLAVAAWQIMSGLLVQLG